MSKIKDYLVKTLRELADNLDAGNSEIDDEQAIQIMKLVAHKPLSKEQAAMHLNMSTKKFDLLIREGYLPKGRRKLGWKEKIWYEDEIDKSYARLDE